MKSIKPLVLSALTVMVACCLFLPLVRPARAEISAPLPQVIQSGLAVYASGGADPALSVWQRGGPLEEDRKAAIQGEEFRDMIRPFGHYQSYELIASKEVCKTSRVFYLALNYERGAAFASFVVYKARKDWVVQSMDFHTKPEYIMPWLTSAAGK